MTKIDELQQEIKKLEEDKKKAWFDKREIQEKINENKKIIQCLSHSEKNTHHINKRKAGG